MMESIQTLLGRRVLFFDGGMGTLLGPVIGSFIIILLIELSSTLLGASGGTQYTVEYAWQKNRELVVIDPDTLERRLLPPRLTAF